MAADSVENLFIIINNYSTHVVCCPIGQCTYYSQHWLQPKLCWSCWHVSTTLLPHLDSTLTFLYIQTQWTSWQMERSSLCNTEGTLCCNDHHQHLPALLVRGSVSVLCGFWGHAIAHVDVLLTQLPEGDLGQVCLDWDFTRQHLWSQLLNHCLVLCQYPAGSKIWWEEMSELLGASMQGKGNIMWGTWQQLLFGQVCAGWLLCSSMTKS